MISPEATVVTVIVLMLVVAVPANATLAASPVQTPFSNVPSVTEKPLILLPVKTIEVIFSPLEAAIVVVEPL